MIDKTKIFVVGALCLVGLAGFMIASNNSDTDSVVNGFKQTTNGSYFDKHLRAGEDIQLPEESKPNSGSAVGGPYVEVPVPDDLSPASILAWIDTLHVCDTRKAFIRNGVEITEKALYNMNGHDNWATDNIVGNTIECSGFIAWCCRRAGINAFSAPSTAGIAPHYEVTDNPMPGDIANVTAAERVAHGAHYTVGHVGIYLGKQANGTAIFLHAGGKTNTPTPKISPHMQLASWGHFYIHPDIKAADLIYESQLGK